MHSYFAVLMTLFAVLAKSSPVVYPALYVEPKYFYSARSQKHSIPLRMYPTTLGRGMQHKLLMGQRMESHKRARFRNVEAQTAIRYPQIRSHHYSPVIRTYPPSPLWQQRRRTRVTRRYYEPPVVMRSGHHGHRNLKNRSRHLLGSILERPRINCPPKEEQQQIYAVLSSVLDHLSNHSVQQIIHEKIVLYKRCSWRSCVPHRHKVHIVFALAPPGGCIRKEWCGCRMGNQISTITCRANATIYSSDQVHNLTVNCDNNFVVRKLEPSSSSLNSISSPYKLVHADANEMASVDGSSTDMQHRPHSKSELQRTPFIELLLGENSEH